MTKTQRDALRFQLAEFDIWREPVAFRPPFGKNIVTIPSLKDCCAELLDELDTANKRIEELEKQSRARDW